MQFLDAEDTDANGDGGEDQVGADELGAHLDVAEEGHGGLRGLCIAWGRGSAF